jgi:hypothetical protein
MTCSHMAEERNSQRPRFEHLKTRRLVKMFLVFYGTGMFNTEIQTITRPCPFVALIQYAPTRFPVFPITTLLPLSGSHNSSWDSARISHISSLKCWLHVQSISPSYCVNTQVLVLFHITRKGDGQNQPTRH